MNGAWFGVLLSEGPSRLLVKRRIDSLPASTSGGEYLIAPAPFQTEPQLPIATHTIDFEKDLIPPVVRQASLHVLHRTIRNPIRHHEDLLSEYRSPFHDNLLAYIPCSSAQKPRRNLAATMMHHRRNSQRGRYSRMCMVEEKITVGREKRAALRVQRYGSKW